MEDHGVESCLETTPHPMMKENVVKIAKRNQKMIAKVLKEGARKKSVNDVIKKGMRPRRVVSLREVASATQVMSIAKENKEAIRPPMILVIATADGRIRVIAEGKRIAGDRSREGDLMTVRLEKGVAAGTFQDLRP